MIFLPVAERELRVAARKRSTVLTRVVGALAALAITLLFLGAFSFRTFGVSSSSHGQIVFNILLWLTFVATLLAGLFLTADTISEEKREGTFGLLFLTDLTGFDVVVGKLLASSLVGFYALLAVFPVMAIPLLMGGVTGTEFWKSIVALVSTMLLSLSCGLFVSTLTRGSHRAMMGTFGLLAALTTAGPLCDWIIALNNPSAHTPFLSLTSPAFLLTQAKAWTLDRFAFALAINQAVAALLFLAAIFLAPTRWQDRATGGNRGTTFGGTPNRAARSHRSNRESEHRSRDPIRWLHSRQPGSRRMAWAWAWLLAISTIALIASAGTNDLQGWSMVAGFLVVPLYLLASMSGRFLLEGRRSGSLELLLTTPVSPREIILGQWRGCRRQFGGAVLLIVLAQTTLSVASTWQMWVTLAGIATSPPPPPPSASVSASNSPSVAASPQPTSGAETSTKVTITVRGAGISLGRSGTTVSGGGVTHTVRWLELGGAVGIGLLSGLATLLNLAAVFWYGLWAGLTSSKPALASLKTLAFVQVIPWLIIAFATFVMGPMILFGLLQSATSSWFPQWYFGLMTGTAALLSIGKDLFYIWWARRGLFGELPHRATLTLSSR